jgi:uncharacterized protein DUF6364
LKTTLVIPDAILRRAKSMAAARGISLSELVTEALGDKLSGGAKSAEKPWMKHVGKLKHLHKETIRINRLIQESSERIGPQM